MPFDNQLISLIIQKKHAEATSILLEHKHLFTTTDSSGQTLLHIAAKYGNAEMTRYLIQCGSHVNAQDNDGTTPLMLAVTDANDDETVKVLLNANADIYITDFRRSSALRKIIKLALLWLEKLDAARHKQTRYLRILLMFFDRVEELFHIDKELMMRYLRETHCPLSLVMFMKNSAVTSYLLGQGYLLNEHLRNWSTLHVAVLMADPKNVAVLIDYGADVNDQDNQQQTPLFLYDRSSDENKKQVEVLKCIMNNGASLLIPRFDGLTLMEYFFSGGKRNTLMALARCKTDQLTKRTIDGKTALHHWVSNYDEDSYPAIRVLLRKNIDINAIDNEGLTALITAVNHCADDKITFLVKSGARVDFVEIIDKTQLFEAVTEPSGYHVKYAKTANALLNNGRTIDDELRRACNFRSRNNYQLAKLMLKQLVIDEDNTGSQSAVARAKLAVNFDLKKYYESCKFQLQNMKTCIVYENISAFQLLKTSQEKIITYMRNKEFISQYRAFMSIPHRKSLYYDTLRTRVETAVELSQLRGKAVTILCKMTQLYPDPDHYVYHEISKYMNKQDLKNLITVGRRCYCC